MATDDRISLLVRDAQRRIFRLAERDCGLNLKAVGLDSGIPYNTIRSYASGEAIMPVPAMLKLVGVLPDELLSHLLDPVDRHLATNGSEDGDIDALGCETAGFTNEYVAAKSDGVVTSIERGRLQQRARKLAKAAKAVAA